MSLSPGENTVSLSLSFINAYLILDCASGTCLRENFAFRGIHAYFIPADGT